MVGIEAVIFGGDCWSEMTRRTPESPRRLSARKNSRQKASSSESPISMPKISRRPSSVTPVATTTALEVTWWSLRACRYVASSQDVGEADVVEAASSECSHRLAESGTDAIDF